MLLTDLNNNSINHQKLFDMEIQIENITPTLKAYSLKLTNNKVDAEDLFQETIYRVIKNIDKFKPGSNLKAWSVVIMRNLFINAFRRKSDRQTLLFAPTDHALYIASKSNANEGEQELLHKQLVEMVDELPEDFSTPFRMIVEGFKYQEISDLLNVPIGTIKSRIHIARKKLKVVYKSRNLVRA